MWYSPIWKLHITSVLVFIVYWCLWYDSSWYDPFFCSRHRTVQWCIDAQLLKTREKKQFSESVWEGNAECYSPALFTVCFIYSLGVHNFCNYWTALPRSQLSRKLTLSQDIINKLQNADLFTSIKSAVSLYAVSLYVTKHASFVVHSLHASPSFVCQLLKQMVYFCVIADLLQ